MQALEKGKLDFGSHYDKKLKEKSKKELLVELKKIDQKLIDLLTDEKNCKKKIKVPWSKEPVDAVDMFWEMNSHEILHTGWNIAVMDHLNIERFPALKKMWG
jgi:uncharacterized NAD-dependent epimerase/dehydratase family protein